MGRLMIEELEEATEALQGRFEKPEVALILGSGLGAYANGLEQATVIPFSAVPHMPCSRVSGHSGNLVVGTCAGKRVIAMQGRVHLYEGHSPRQVVFGVRLMGWLGATTLIVTNAAGGISPTLTPGELMVITDHLNLTGQSSLLGPNDERLGARFIDMTAAYDPALVELASAVALKQQTTLARGVYAGLLGPAYETPAEVRMLRTLGADAVGMSTVLEVLAARHLGMRVLGISCISNMAAGLGRGKLSHDEVEQTAQLSRPRFEALLAGVLEAIR